MKVERVFLSPYSLSLLIDLFQSSKAEEFQTAEWEVSRPRIRVIPRLGSKEKEDFILLESSEDDCEEGANKESVSEARALPSAVSTQNGVRVGFSFIS